MRSMIVLAAAAAGMAAAVPAQAKELRAEVHGGDFRINDEDEAFIGVAAGYDWDLGANGFFGVEASADKILGGDSDIDLGASARIGIKNDEDGKLYALTGYTFRDAADSWHIGAGYQHKVTGNVYLKLEYRHHMADAGDADALALGLGMTF